MCRDIREQKPKLDELVRRCREFSECLKGKEEDEEHAQGMRDLWRDVMLKAGRKIRDLQNTLRSLLANNFDMNKEENFTWSICDTDVNELVKNVEEMTPVDKNDDIAVELVNYQVFTVFFTLYHTILGLKDQMFLTLSHHHCFDYFVN